MDIALVSCLTLPEPDPDAAPLAGALAAAGIDAHVLAWEDPAVDWSRARLTVFRSSWNYPLHPAEFLAWAEATDRKTRLWNPLRVVRWSLHKSYLLDLEARGLPVTPTVLVRRGEPVDIASILAHTGWPEIVIKPAVSAASFRTRRFGPAEREAAAAHLAALAGERDVLVQEYLPSVAGYGERALVWIDGEITHAVRKSPRFEGQVEVASTTAVMPSAEERAIAERAMASIDAPLLYGRVDLAPGPDGQPVIMELELVEPSLYFARSQAALDRYVSAVQRLLVA